MPVDHSTAKDLLNAAQRAVEESSVPDSLREVAFVKAFDFLAGGAVAPQRSARGQSDGGQGGGAGAADPGSDVPPDTTLDFSTADDFFAEHPSGKPHENARLATAYLYSVYGTSPFSFDDVRAVAEHAGLTISERLDMTLGDAKTGGKAMFKSAGRGLIQPTVAGEVQMRTKYDITKGKKKRA